MKRFVLGLVLGGVIGYLISVEILASVTVVPCSTEIKDQFGHTAVRITSCEVLTSWL